MMAIARRRLDFLAGQNDRGGGERAAHCCIGMIAGIVDTGTWVACM